MGMPSKTIPPFVYFSDYRHSPATTVSASVSLTRTCSMRPTSVHACRLRTLFRRIAMNTLHISACKERVLWIRERWKILLWDQKSTGYIKVCTNHRPRNSWNYLQGKTFQIKITRPVYYIYIIYFHENSLKLNPLRKCEFSSLYLCTIQACRAQFTFHPSSFSLSTFLNRTNRSLKQVFFNNKMESTQGKDAKRQSRKSRVRSSLDKEFFRD